MTCDDYCFTTGQPGWGIAWYINEQLIPELTLMRGENYTFRVFGGNNASIANRASYHPFYITDSSSGGRLLSTPDQRTVRHAHCGCRAYACLSNSTFSFGVFFSEDIL